jgi:hypothetical protein
MNNVKSWPEPLSIDLSLFDSANICCSFNNVSNVASRYDHSRVPYSVPELSHSGSPYGLGSIVGPLSNKAIIKADIEVARVFGKRIVEITIKLLIDLQKCCLRN